MNIKKGFKDKLLDSLLPSSDAIITEYFRDAYPSSPYCRIPTNYEERELKSAKFKNYIVKTENKTGLSQSMIIERMIEIGLAQLYDD